MPLDAYRIDALGWLTLVVSWLVVAGCGRVRFDPIGDGVVDASRDSDDGVLAPSCAGLESSCGPTGTSSCCDSSLVPGGTFYRSFDVGTDNAYTDMTNPATVSDFRLDTYEVTVGRFRQFVNAGMGTQTNPPPSGAGARMLDGMTGQGGWDPAWNASLVADTAALIAAVKCSATYQAWVDTPGVNDTLPINCITWYEAFAFCTWDGGFLPTEAEWNYAAAGGSEQRAYPWSSPASSLALDCTYANSDPTCVNSPIGGVNRVGSESPAGDGRWGHADLIGNLWELTLDFQGPYENPCGDCVNLTPASSRVTRGGAFGDTARGASRYFSLPVPRNDTFGIRCARVP